MTKHDRAKMVRRFHAGFDNLGFNSALRQELVNFTAREVDRAVRAERKAQRATEELWESQRRRAEERFIERAKGIGRKQS